MDDIGRDLTATESILVRAIAQKSTLEALAFDRVFATDDAPMPWLLSLSNSKRRDIESLNRLLADHNKPSPLDYDSYVRTLRDKQADDEQAGGA